MDMIQHLWHSTISGSVLPALFTFGWLIQRRAGDLFMQPPMWSLQPPLRT